MNIDKGICRTLVAAFAVTLAFGMQISAMGAPVGGTNPNLFYGRYHEINSGLQSEILSFKIDEEGLAFYLGGLYDLMFGHQGTPRNFVTDANSISFDATLEPMPGTDGATNIPAHFTLTEEPSGIYQLEVTYTQDPGYPLNTYPYTIQMYRSDDDDYRILGEVPANVGERVTIAGLLKALAPYVFLPEMMATRYYLRDRSGLSDTEVVRQDERNRYLDYSWGDMGTCMDCKYWHTTDGNILLVVNFHDATYEYPQRLRFFKFDRKRGTVQELITALSDQWPCEPDDSNGGICYQVRYDSDGIVALVPQKNGDSFDVVTIKFDGEMFR